MWQKYPPLKPVCPHHTRIETSSSSLSAQTAIFTLTNSPLQLRSHCYLDATEPNILRTNYSEVSEISVTPPPGTDCLRSATTCWQMCQNTQTACTACFLVCMFYVHAFEKRHGLVCMCSCEREKEWSQHTRVSLPGQSSIRKEHKGQTLTFLMAQKHSHTPVLTSALSGPWTSPSNGLTELSKHMVQFI